MTINFVHIHDQFFAYFAKPQAAAELTFAGLFGVLVAYRFERKRSKENRANTQITLKLPVYEFFLNQMYVQQEYLENRIRSTYDEMNQIMADVKLAYLNQDPPISAQMNWAHYRGISPLKLRGGARNSEDTNNSTENPRIPLENVRLIFRSSERLSGLISKYIDHFDYVLVALGKLEEAFAEEKALEAKGTVQQYVTGDELFSNDYVNLVNDCALWVEFIFKEIEMQIYLEISRVIPKESRAELRQNRSIKEEFNEYQADLPDIPKLFEEYHLQVQLRETEYYAPPSQRVTIRQRLVESTNFKIAKFRQKLSKSKG